MNLARFITVLFFSSFLTAYAAVKEDITVSNAYVRATPPGKTMTAAFLKLENTSDQEHRLIAVDSSAAGTTELHQTVNEQGLLKMRPVTEMTIAAHSTQELQPGGYHIMLVDLKQPLKIGQTIPLTLSFASGEKLTLKIPVKSVIADVDNQ